MSSVFIWLLAVVFWAVCAGVAAVVAPEGRRAEFAALTFVFLGPLGVGFASVATQRWRVIVPIGRRPVMCPRCTAQQFIDRHDVSFTCWRCSTVAGGLAVDDMVEVVAGGDKRRGQVGTVYELCSPDGREEGDVLVRFDGESDAYVYEFQELKKI